MSKLTEQTLIPLSLVITILGGVIWLSVMYQKVEAGQLVQRENRIEIQELKRDQAQYKTDVTDRLARMETKIDALLKSRKQGD